MFSRRKALFVIFLLLFLLHEFRPIDIFVEFSSVHSVPKAGCHASVNRFHRDSSEHNKGNITEIPGDDSIPRTGNSARLFRKRSCLSRHRRPLRSCPNSESWCEQSCVHDHFLVSSVVFSWSSCGFDKEGSIRCKKKVSQDYSEMKRIVYAIVGSTRRWLVRRKHCITLFSLSLSLCCSSDHTQLRLVYYIHSTNTRSKMERTFQTPSIHRHITYTYASHKYHNKH